MSDRELGLLPAMAVGGGAVVLFVVFFLSADLATATHLRDCKNSSSPQSCAASEWGLESEYGRMLLQTSSPYIEYGSLDKDRAAGQASKPGNSYSRGCQKDYDCRSGD